MVLTTALLLSPAQVEDQQPPWRPFKTERDVEEPLGKKLLRVGGAILACVGAGGIAAGTVLGGGGTIVLAATGRLLTASTSVSRVDGVEDARSVLVVVAGVASAVVLAGGVVAVLGGLTAIAGLVLFVWGLLAPAG